jgi:uncharacterized protein (DUF983 family)
MKSEHPSMFSSLVACKCPQCRTGKMFEFKATHITKYSRMHEHCKVCGLRFEIEPGFFWGAMYISYAITTGILIILGLLILWLGNNPDFWVYFSIIVSTVILLTPFIYRYSRAMMIYFISPVRFNPKLVAHVHSN